MDPGSCKGATRDMVLDRKPGVTVHLLSRSLTPWVSGITAMFDRRRMSHILVSR